MTGKGICRDYGLMARVHLKKAPDGKLELRAVEAIPVHDTHFRPRRLTGEAGAARVYALNYLDADLGDGAGARGVMFTPQAGWNRALLSARRGQGRWHYRRPVQELQARAADTRPTARCHRQLLQPLTAHLRDGTSAG